MHRELLPRGCNKLGWFVFFFFGLGLHLAQGQQGFLPTPQVGVGRSWQEGKWRLQLGEVGQYSFKTSPFSTITGSTLYDENKAANGNTLTLGSKSNPSLSVFEYLASWTPSFGTERLQGTGFFLPGAWSIGFQHAHFYQTKTQAAGKESVSSPGLPDVSMDLFYESIPLRLYLFPTEGVGVNGYFGVNLGFMHGTFLFDMPDGRQEVASFSKFPTNSSTIGLEVTMQEGFSWFRFEINQLNAEDVEITRNFYPGRSDKTTLDMSGSTMRVAFVWQFN